MVMKSALLQYLCGSNQKWTATENAVCKLHFSVCESHSLTAEKFHVLVMILRRLWRCVCPVGLRRGKIRLIPVVKNLMFIIFSIGHRIIHSGRATYLCPQDGSESIGSRYNSSFHKLGVRHGPLSSIILKQYWENENYLCLKLKLCPKFTNRRA